MMAGPDEEQVVRAKVIEIGCPGRVDSGSAVPQVEVRLQLTLEDARKLGPVLFETVEIRLRRT